ncbi:cupin domain-containing protein [Nocardia jiangsuensis]|uniref:Cupin domain-containing protein n=1 Tax=Nocardia jiangsuensis TaxID=1691563 RepID=A0ABV8DNQ8_9NOCA
MTDLDIEIDDKGILIPEAEQTAVSLLGGLAQIRVPGKTTRDSFTVVEHTGKRGYNTPLHYHHIEDEVFIVLDGALRMVCDGKEQLAEAGTTMVIPRMIAHGFVAISDEVRFLTIHSTPELGNKPQFDLFLAAEMPAAHAARTPTEGIGPDLDHIIALGTTYGYSYAGPAPMP